MFEVVAVKVGTYTVVEVGVIMLVIEVDDSPIVVLLTNGC